jgi:hypothetical protein
MDQDRSGRWCYRIDALRLIIRQYQDCRFWLYQARWLSSPSNSIVPKGLRWRPRFIRGSESALRRHHDEVRNDRICWSHDQNRQSGRKLVHGAGYDHQAGLRRTGPHLRGASGTLSFLAQPGHRPIFRQHSASIRHLFKPIGCRSPEFGDGHAAM